MKNVGRGTRHATRNLKVSSLDSLLNSLLNKYHRGKFPAIEFDLKWDVGFDITGGSRATKIGLPVPPSIMVKPSLSL